MLLFLASCQNLLAQYTLNGNATQDACNAYSLTQAAGNQSGSVWNNNKINLTQSFDFNFDINLGSNDAGADGIAFVLQPLSTSVGSSGGGLGYNGITPAVGVTIDTWQNGNDNDPAYDHIAIQLNGDLNHNTANNIAGPVTAINGNNNIEDGIWHSLRIQWDVATTTLSIYVDGSLRISAVRDLVNTVFSGSPLVFWGFTGSTGGANNHQQFRTALNPSFHFGPAQKRCIGESIQFFDSSVSFTNIAKFYWDFGDGSPLDSVNLNPIHTYVTANDFIVKQRVIGADGCEATNTQTVRIGSKPIAGFKTDDNCVDNPIHFTDTSTAAVGTINNWYWDFGDATISVVQNPTKNYLTGGNKDVKLVVKTLEGCESDTLPKLIHIYNKPIANFNFTDSVCLGSPTFFFDNSVPAGDPINKWAWTFSDSTGVVGTPNAAHYFSSPGHHTAILGVSANGTTGCLGIITKDVFVVNKPTANFKYNTICQSAVATFTDSSYAPDGVPVNQWWWNVNGGITSIQNTITTTYVGTGTDTVKLVIRNAKGCVSDTLKKPVIIDESENCTGNP